MGDATEDRSTDGVDVDVVVTVNVSHDRAKKERPLGADHVVTPRRCPVVIEGCPKGLVSGHHQGALVCGDVERAETVCEQSV